MGGFRVKFVCASYNCDVNVLVKFEMSNQGFVHLQSLVICNCGCFALFFMRRRRRGGEGTMDGGIE